MGVKISGRYLGEKRIELVHEESGATIVTDAPKDNQGEGRSFSPTDLFAASLASCVMTIMAINAEPQGVDLSGMHMELEKRMTAAPRRVGSVSITIHLPKAVTSENRERLEQAAAACPVHNSFHPDVEAKIEYVYNV